MSFSLPAVNHEMNAPEQWKAQTPTQIQIDANEKCNTLSCKFVWFLNWFFPTSRKMKA